MRYEFSPDARTYNGGRVLLGGSPLTFLRLSERGGRLAAKLGASDEISLTEAQSAFADRLVELGLLLARPALGEGPYATTDVTVVVPVFDRSDALATCLGALNKADTGLRVVVVDDGSRDPEKVAEVVDRFGGELIRCDTNRGPAAARNVGLAAVDAPLVAFVDSDVTVTEGWLPWLIRHFAQPTVAMVAPRVVGVSNAIAGSGALVRYETARSPLDLGSTAGRIRRRSRLAYVPAATMVVRADAARSIGGFDESMGVGEDVDFCWRLADAGWSCWYGGDDATVEHNNRVELGSWASRRVQYGESAALLDDRHPGSVAPLSISGWSAGAWGFAALGHPVIAAGIVAGTTAALIRKLDFLESPRPAIELALRGHAGAGELIGRALIRPWWPGTLAAAAVSRRARRLAIAAAVVPPLLEWRRRRPDVDPFRWVALSIIDDVAYSAGVWAGSARARSVGALRPDFRNWPGRGGHTVDALHARN